LEIHTMAQDAIALLEADHVRVEELFAAFKAARGNPAAKLDIAQTICMELTLHSMVEEEIFYPAFAAATGNTDIVDHAEVEHQKVKELIAKVPDAENLDGAVEVLMRNVMHHVEEERREMFAKARASGMELATLAGRMQTRRQEVFAAVQAA
jgi:iron-sulfur cluster repair protein YtfE (RIC family)